MRHAILAAFVLLTWTLGAPAADPSEVVCTGRLMDVNGQTTVPTGLFGVHAVGLTPELVEDLGIECYRGIHFVPGAGSVRVGKKGGANPVWEMLDVIIDCQGDRYHAPECLTNPNYAERFASIGRAYGERARKEDWDAYAEFWNEPYLNWAERSHGGRGTAYDPKYYDVSKAVDGGKVTLKWRDEPLEHMRWRRLLAKGNRDGRIGYDIPVPEGAKPGDTFESRHRWYWYGDREPQTFTVLEQWDVYDAAAAGWWSGPQNCDFYLWMFLPWAKALKEANPDVKVLAGWDFAFSQGDWALWRQNLRPVLDAGIQYIDGVTDHHYGTDTRWTTVWYEVACAYTQSHYGKWMKGYNTECGGKLDPAVYGSTGGGSATPELAWTLRDILELIYRSPAKSGSRTAHHLRRDGGAGQALRFLRDLRGGLVHVATEDPDLWPVASLNGDRLVVVVLNNAKAPRDVKLKVVAPRAATFSGGERSFAGETKAERASASGRDADLACRLPSLQAVKWVLPLKGTPPAKPQLRRRQFFSKTHLAEVTQGKPISAPIEVDPAALKGAEAAYLQLCVEGVKAENATVEVNGRRIRLPDRNHTVRVPLKVADVKAKSDLRFTCGGEPWQLDMASIVVETPAD